MGTVDAARGRRPGPRRSSVPGPGCGTAGSARRRRTARRGRRGPCRGGSRWPGRAGAAPRPGRGGRRPGPRRRRPGRSARREAMPPRKSAEPNTMAAPRASTTDISDLLRSLWWTDRCTVGRGTAVHHPDHCGDRDPRRGAMSRGETRTGPSEGSTPTPATGWWRSRPGPTPWLRRCRPGASGVGLRPPPWRRWPSSCWVAPGWDLRRRRPAGLAAGRPTSPGAG